LVAAGASLRAIANPPLQSCRACTALVEAAGSIHSSLPATWPWSWSCPGQGRAAHRAEAVPGCELWAEAASQSRHQSRLTLTSTHCETGKPSHHGRNGDQLADTKLLTTDQHPPSVGSRVVLGKAPTGNQQEAQAAMAETWGACCICTSCTSCTSCRLTAAPAPTPTTHCTGDPYLRPRPSARHVVCPEAPS
jgi:hypothetical protein